MSFRRYLEVLAEQERGENLPTNHVPSTFLFAFAGTRIVGRVSIRHSVNSFLERVGGHIGYVVVPEYHERRRLQTLSIASSLDIAGIAQTSRDSESAANIAGNKGTGLESSRR